MHKDAVVVSVSRDDKHRFNKRLVDEIELIEGIGIKGDAHAGTTVQHRSRVRADPTQPNLRQVHLLHGELFAELRDHGFDVAPGQLGENVVTSGVDLLALPRRTVLRIGPQAAIEMTGLRNPCKQIETFKPGLLKEVVGRDNDGNVVRKAGVMSIVIRGGTVRPGDRIVVELPGGPHEALDRV